jgi:hypothetical protein
MMSKQWITEYEGHRIRVVNSWFSGIKLYVDGDLRDTNTQLVSLDSSQPLLSARVPLRGGEASVVEVFVKALVTTKAKICADGRQIGGDSF